MRSRLSISCRPLFDALEVIASLQDPLHEDPGGMNVVALDAARVDQVLHFGERGLRRRRHDRVEVARRAPVDEIAGAVTLPGLDEREVRTERALHQVLAAVELADLLALGDERADAGRREEGGNARTAGA